MANNHIGTAFEILKEVADDLGYNYSYGDLTMDPERSRIIYPLVHTTLQPLQVGSKTTVITLNVMVADVVNHLATENEEEDLATKYSIMGYTENQNFAHVLQEIYVRFCSSLYKIQYERYEEFKFRLPISMNPFIEAGSDVVAGYTMTINLEIRSPWVTDGRC